MKLIVFNSNDVDGDGTGYTIYNANNFLGMTTDIGPIEDYNSKEWTMYPLLHFRFKYDWMTQFDPLIEPTDHDEKYDIGREDFWIIYDSIENAKSKEDREQNTSFSLTVSKNFINRFMEFLVNDEEKIFDMVKELDIIINELREKK